MPVLSMASRVITLRFGNQTDSTKDRSIESLSAMTFSRTKDYFLYECGQDRDREPFASFAASELNTALCTTFGRQNGYQALASDDETVIELTFRLDLMSRLNDTLRSNVFDPVGDRWRLESTPNPLEYTLVETLNRAGQTEPEVRRISVVLKPMVSP